MSVIIVKMMIAANNPKTIQLKINHPIPPSTISGLKLYSSTNTAVFQNNFKYISKQIICNTILIPDITFIFIVPSLKIKSYSLESFLSLFSSTIISSSDTLIRSSTSCFDISKYLANSSILTVLPISSSKFLTPSFKKFTLLII